VDRLSLLCCKQADALGKRRVTRGTGSRAAPEHKWEGGRGAWQVLPCGATRNRHGRYAAAGMLRQLVAETYRLSQAGSAVAGSSAEQQVASGRPMGTPPASCALFKAPSALLFQSPKPGWQSCWAMPAGCCLPLVCYARLTPLVPRAGALALWNHQPDGGDGSEGMQGQHRCPIVPQQPDLFANGAYTLRCNQCLSNVRSLQACPMAYLLHSPWHRSSTSPVAAPLAPCLSQRCPPSRKEGCGQTGEAQ